MRLKVEINDTAFEVDLEGGTSIAIDLDFDGPQPSHFGADKASRSPMRVGSFVGRTVLGGGCNADDIRLNPHCNGTHTETVGHIVDQPVHIASAVIDALFPVALVSVQPAAVQATSEIYRPALVSGDSVITRALLEAAVQDCPCKSLDGIQALIVRTLPNSSDKRSRVYDADNQPAFFTVDAIQYVNDLPITHLLVDIPSIDRVADEGMLTNHHLFWNIPEGTSELTKAAKSKKTITEMVFVPDALRDGLYLINLQVAAFCSNAAPSRPILFSISEIKNG